MKLEIDQAVLYAMRHLHGVNDIRFYLNGVLLDIRPDAIVIVATDGHLLGMYRHSAACDDLTPRQIIIPADMIERLKPGKHDATCFIDYDPASHDLHIRTVSGLGIHGKALDGRFPDYQRIVPKTISGEATHQYNPALITRFAKFAADAWKVKKDTNWPQLSYNGKDAALVRLDERNEFVGVVMPLRDDTRFKSTPAWALTYKETMPGVSKEVREAVERIAQAQPA